jgi:hypothetical protein
LAQLQFTAHNPGNEAYRASPITGSGLSIMFRNTMLTAALLAAGFVSTNAALAAEPFTVFSQGENFSVTYAPGYTGNIVGGGTVISTGGGKDTTVRYARPNHVASVGIPVFQGGSEGDVAYIAPQSTGALAAK